MLQIPSEKVFRPKKTTPNTVSESVGAVGYRYCGDNDRGINHY